LGVSFDREGLTDSQIAAMNTEISTFLAGHPDKIMSVYINPREVPGVAAKRAQLGQGNGVPNGEKSQYTNTLQILAGAPSRAFVIIPAYCYVPAKGTEREHGVNTWDAIALAQICNDRSVTCVMAMGVWAYAENVDSFRSTLTKLKTNLPAASQTTFAYFEMVDPPLTQSYRIVPEMLQDIKDAFGHL
jgi:hypothetical protein